MYGVREANEAFPHLCGSDNGDAAQLAVERIHVGDLAGTGQYFINDPGYSQNMADLARLVKHSREQATGETITEEALAREIGGSPNDTYYLANLATILGSQPVAYARTEESRSGQVPTPYNGQFFVVSALEVCLNDGALQRQIASKLLFKLLEDYPRLTDDATVLFRGRASGEGRETRPASLLQWLGVDKPFIGEWGGPGAITFGRKDDIVMRARRVQAAEERIRA